MMHGGRSDIDKHASACETKEEAMQYERAKEVSLGSKVPAETQLRVLTTEELDAISGGRCPEGTVEVIRWNKGGGSTSTCEG